jgi:CTP:molybdopterin cytidylyltransferase MocA
MSARRVTTAVIAAGGRASRFGCRSPKSMLTVNGVPLLIYTVKSILNAGVTRVIVCLNRPEWQREMARSLENIPEVEMVIDKGYPSTFPMGMRQDP